MKRFSDKLISVLIAGTLILIFLTAYTSGGKGRSSEHTTNHLKEFSYEGLSVRSGDLIFRNGRGMISNAFRLTSLQQPLYSHAGIVHCDDTGAYVIHIIDGGKTAGKIQLEPLSSFCDPAECTSFGVYRPDMNLKMVDKYSVSYLKQGILFDSKFDLTSEDRMYCTEFVYKVLQKSDPGFLLPLTTVSGQKYVACDDLFLLKGTKLVYSHSY
jgi:hypothetical protein